MLEVRNLTYRYTGSGNNALSDVSFRVNEGEICGFLAPNGGGKTTLFKLLATMIPVQDGRLLYNGEDYRNKLAAVRNTIGVVFQSPSIDKKLTVRENLNCQTYLYGHSPRSAKKNIDETIDLFGLGNYVGKNLETLSGGFQRRVELAKCMLHNPQIIILDEPSTGLDIGSRRDLWNYLQTVRDRKNVTILVTTHLTEEAEQCDRVIILSDGKLVVSGSPATLKDEIGGKILSIKTHNVSDLLSLLRNKWGVEGISVNGLVRVEIRDNKTILQSLLTDHIDLIDTATLSKPSLADVFFKYTGNRFVEAQGEEAS